MVGLGVDGSVVLLQHGAIGLDLGEIEAELSGGRELSRLLGPAVEVGGETSKLHAELLLLELARKIGIEAVLLSSRLLGQRVREAVRQGLQYS